MCTTLTCDMYNGSKSSTNIQIESQYMNFYMNTIVIFLLSVSIITIFTVEMYKILPLPFELVKIKCKYANRKPKWDFLFDGNVFPVQEIDSRNV